MKNNPIVGALFVAATLAISPATAQDFSPIESTFISHTPAGRGQFAEALKRLLLGNGISANVAAFERKDSSIRDPAGIGYPKLWLFAYFNDSVVYQLTTKLQILQHAKKLEFKSVEFQSKGSNGGYWYNLAGPTVPACDVVKRLCL